MFKSKQMPKCILILKMPNLKEERICIKFCISLGKSGPQTYDMIQQTPNNRLWGLSDAQINILR